MDFLIEKSYCAQTDVERAMGVAAGETNVTQAQILQAIKDASDEVDLITHTRYHSVEDSGTATTGGTTTLTDSTQSWTVDEWANFVIWIYGGTGSGQYARIASNTATILTYHTDDELANTTDTTSTYRIIPDAISTQSIDGNNLTNMYFHPFPIKSLLSLGIAGTTVTASKVYVYEKTGELKLHSQLAPEMLSFRTTYPQDIIVKYVFGVYPIPAHINRLAANVAAMQCLIEQIGGTYNDITSYTIPHMTASKGEPYTNIRETLSRLIKETEKLIIRVNKHHVVVG